MPFFYWNRLLTVASILYRMLERPDASLDPARCTPTIHGFSSGLVRSYAVARQAFVDAGGERLLGVSVPEI